jgi:hypothetical protein
MVGATSRRFKAVNSTMITSYTQMHTNPSQKVGPRTDRRTSEKLKIFTQLILAEEFSGSEIQEFEFDGNL